MSWPATIAIALITAVAGMFVAGYTAILAASWYGISSFEGQSGYFVVMLALAGLVLGLIVGAVVARIVSAGFPQAAGAALGVVLGLVLLIGGTARLLADVPPRIDGDTLLLALEYRWPASQVEAPVAGADDPRVRLSSVNGSIERKGVSGAFWFDDSRREDGRWITPAAVAVFTERGKRVVAFIVDGEVRSGVIVPLPSRPGDRHLQWSDWLPADVSPNPDGASYRFRVHRAGEPIRTEWIGPFEIEMSAADFWLTRDKQDRQRVDAMSVFRIKHQGEPVVVEYPGMYGASGDDTLDRALAVAVVDGPQPTLLACMLRYDNPCFLLVSENAGVRTDFVTELPDGIAGYELTADQSRYEMSLTRSWLWGRVEKQLFERGRVYQLGPVLLDTRGPNVNAAREFDELTVQRWEPPATISPDGRSFVRIGTEMDSQKEVLAVTDLDGGSFYILPLDRSRMRFVQRAEIGPDWVNHHFEWIRNGDGVDRLVERREFEPLLRRGTLSAENRGYREYRVDSANESLLDALLEFLVEEMGADRNVERIEYQTAYTVVVDGIPIRVGYDDMGKAAYVTSDFGSESAPVIVTIAERFDAALATGRYDHLFEVH